jgi:hypothetical protein
MANALWVTPAELGTDLADLPEAQIACEAASQLLWSLSGRKFSGPTVVTERYTIAQAPTGLIILNNIPGIAVGTLVTTSLIRQEDLKRSRITLRGKNVKRILGVYTEDGERVNEDRYTLWDSSFVEFGTRIHGDLYITYEYGGSIPALGRMAAKQLATQFTLSLSGREDECVLPDRVTSVTRQDVSWTILDTQDFLTDLRTGLYSVDLFLKSTNSSKARLKSKVFSPDISRGNKATPKPTSSASPTPIGPEIVVPYNGSVTTSIVLSSYGIDFLAPGQDWITEIAVSTWGGTRSVKLDPSQITVTPTTLEFTINYEDIFGTVGSNPGIWTVYASKNGATSNVLSGNLVYSLEG